MPTPSPSAPAAFDPHQVFKQMWLEPLQFLTQAEAQVAPHLTAWHNQVQAGCDDLARLQHATLGYGLALSAAARKVLQRPLGL